MVARRSGDEELGWGDVLRLPVVRSAMQFISRKTGAPTVVIERFLDDVAYYLQMPRMRETVLKVFLTTCSAGCRTAANWWWSGTAWAPSWRTTC